MILFQKVTVYAINEMKQLHFFILYLIQAKWDNQLLRFLLLLFFMMTN